MRARWVWPTVWAATLVASAAASVVALPPSAGATPQEWIDPTYGDHGVRWIAAEPYTASASAVDGHGRAYVVTADDTRGSSTLHRLTATGLPDSAFAGGGVALFGSGHAIAVDGQNRVTVASTTGQNLLVRRFAGDGAPDTAFGAGGSLAVSLPGAASARLAVVPRSTGVVVMVGADGANTRLVAITDAGALDTTWGADGTVPGVLPVGGESTGIAADGDDVVVVGWAGPDGRDTFMIRYTSSGELDESFGTRGVADLPDVRFVGVQAVDGAYYTHTFFGAAVVAKVTNTGKLDETFGVDGVATGPAGNCPYEPWELMVTERYVYAGASLLSTPALDCESPFPVELTRFTRDGDLDTGYGEGGRVALEFLGGHQIRSGSLTGVQPDGRVLVAVQTMPGGAGAPLTGLVRLRGSLARPGAFVPLPPTRALDTRVGTGAPAGKLAPNGTLDVALAGSGVPAGGASAVVLNVTVTEPDAVGFLSVYPTGGTMPVASNLNFAPGQTVPNLVTVKLGSGSSVSFRNGSAGATHVIADVSGYYAAGVPTDPGAFVALDPARLLDTRAGAGAPAGAVRANGVLRVSVAGHGGVPASGASAVVLNVTVAGPTASGFITVYPTGGAVPVVSNLNYGPGQTVPNLVTVTLGAGGAVSLRNGSAGPTHLVADVAGYYLAGTPTEPGMFVALDPARVLDTRAGTGAAAAGSIPGLGTVNVPVAGRGGVRTGPVAAVVLTVTVTEPAPSGFITVYPTGGAVPVVSNLNYGPGQTVPNLVIVEVGDRGVSFHNGGSAGTHLIADVAGYFIGVDPCPSVC